MSLHFGGAVKALAVGLSLPIRPLPTSDRQLGDHVTATSDSGDTGAVGSFQIWEMAEKISILLSINYRKLAE